MGLIKVYLTDDSGNYLTDDAGHYLLATTYRGFETFPSEPKPYYTMPQKEEIRVFHTEMESGKEESNSIQRFSKHLFDLAYKVNTRSERKIMHDFQRRHNRGDRFWFVDPDLRDWTDEYIGQGGPWEVLGALLKDDTTYTDDTDDANDVGTNDVNLLPAAPVVDQDAFIVIGKNQFDKITFTISTQGAGTFTIIWKYWKSDGTWAALAGVTDGTSGFTAATGAREVTFTIPTDWAISEIEEINGYAIKADLTAFTNITIQPKATQITINSKTFDLPTVTTTSADLVVYIDDEEIAGSGVDYTFVSGGGAGGRDRITLMAYPTTGALITCDPPGYLCIKARLGENGWQEAPQALQLYDFALQVKEIM